MQEAWLAGLPNDYERDVCIEIINQLLNKPELTKPEQDWLDWLSTMVELYEESHSPIEPASDAAILESLLRDRNQTQRDVARATGIAYSTLSCVLHGKRQFTRDHVRAICKHFKISPTVFH